MGILDTLSAAVFGRRGAPSPVSGGVGGRRDLNAPAMLITPRWGPDAMSRRMAVANAMRANPASPASIGIGVRPAPWGSSVTERTKSDAYLPPQQYFRGVTKYIIDPHLKTVTNVSRLPSANAQINPVLLAFGGQPGPRFGTGLGA